MAPTGPADAPAPQAPAWRKDGDTVAAPPSVRYLRITFSEGVRASMKPWRLKMRSAYFISGAAVFGRSMP
ncbi:hypothetical protein AZSP09_00080 [Azospira sp. I09]|nr:hypothetical protein AZSP09_00080 [Azospira sp. I09]